ncbi:uncharacterized protein EV154DRAFT_520101 [Mucor mucedo]|uniref:uncharacterized protein n=1 Tax=Mucor mucedo TaxID=29922 RepID=UPI00221E7B82|nr:uncharacterized protein EV154DRAFT_520101 [Mucor mucedo]KAI7887699.1 hypothetical protein EV154DRAFT_520101 [Mucor mucedo]
MSSPSSSTKEEATVETREATRSPSPLKKTVIETRRAEQNRAAQRAFRQRKERYVKELEAKVNSMADWPTRMEQLENENEGLKRKIHELIAKQDETNKKMFILDSSSNKLAHPSTTLPPLASSSSSALASAATQSTSIAVATPTEKKSTSPPAKVAGEKGRVLDDLVSILRTRNRPPIPSHHPPSN